MALSGNAIVVGLLCLIVIDGTMFHVAHAGLSSPRHAASVKHHKGRVDRVDHVKVHGHKDHEPRAVDKHGQHGLEKAGAGHGHHQTAHEKQDTGVLHHHAKHTNGHGKAKVHGGHGHAKHKRHKEVLSAEEEDFGSSSQGGAEEGKAGPPGPPGPAGPPGPSGDRRDSPPATRKEEQQPPPPPPPAIGKRKAPAAAPPRSAARDTNNAATPPEPPVEAEVEVEFDIQSDAGEECDDEVTLLLALLRAAKHPKERYNLVLTDPDGQAHFEKIRGSIAIPSNFAVMGIADYLAKAPFHPNAARRVVLQIGPVTGVDEESTKALVERLGSYRYAIVGTIGNTFNSKGAAQAYASSLLAGSALGNVIDTARGTGAPKFTVSALEGVFGADHPIIEHVLRIGFRNAIGRASWRNGKYGAGLVSALPTGANYQTVVGLVKALGTEAEPITDAHRKIAKAYIADLQTAGPKLTIDETGSTNALNGATEQQIEDGYAYILANTEAILGMPVEFYESGARGNWNPVWDTLGKQDLTAEDPRFEPKYNVEEKDLDAKVRTAYAKWTALCKKHPTLQTTPAYDVLGLVAAVCLAEGRELIELFETDPEEKSGVWKLRSLDDLEGLMKGLLNSK